MVHNFGWWTCKSFQLEEMYPRIKALLASSHDRVTTTSLSLLNIVGGMFITILFSFVEEVNEIMKVMEF